MSNARADEECMREALRIAARGMGRVNPNPMVGALIVKGGRVIARGYHRAVGHPHAEAKALKAAGKKDVRGATLYVNLEPCNHFGRTPPCTEAIIRSGIARVVFSTRDPNPVAAGGMEKLRRAGIKVSVGVLSNEARALNETFFTFHEKRRPFVVLKFAVSLDGKMATYAGDSKWLTSRAARAYARRLRGMHQALVVGIETILADDPHLGSRTRSLPDPMRVVLDSKLRIPVGAKVLRDKNILIATTRRASRRKMRLLRRRGIRVLMLGNVRISMRRLLGALRRLNVVSVLVEGGGGVLGSFVDAGVADKAYAFYAPTLIGGKNAISVGGRGARLVASALRFRNISTRRFDDTVLIEASVRS